MTGDPLRAVGEVLCALLPGQRPGSVSALGRGHIHQTWVVQSVSARGDPARHVVQRINHAVFRDPPVLAANLELVTRHLRGALDARKADDAERRCLVPVEAPDGRTLHRDPAGGWWRAFPFIENTHALATPDSPAQAREAARAFGGFLADLADLDPERLTPTIPDFHDLPGRLGALDAAAALDAAGRATSVTGEIAAAHRFAAHLAGAAELAPGVLPRRVVHNDCKLDNLLIDDATGEALCVVDLDTVMPGHVIFDFGELVRSCFAAEDERDLDRVRVDLALFEALAQGFVDGARGMLTRAEVRALALAGPRMALENGVRFLTDHLEGDPYFPTARPDHNLDRARAQLRLAECLLDAESELRARCDGLVRGTP